MYLFGQNVITKKKKYTYFFNTLYIYIYFAIVAHTLVFSREDFLGLSDDVSTGMVHVGGH